MRERLLLVERDSRRRGAIRGALGAAGFEVREASSAAEAIQLIREDTVGALVIADEARQLALRGLCGQVRKATPDARVFFLLSSESDPARVAKLVSGAVLLARDLTPEQVATRVLESYGARAPDVWRFTKARPLKVGRLWEVHLARTEVGREVLLTQLSEQFAHDGELRAEFLDVAAAAARVEHENLPRVLGLGGARDIPFVISEVEDGTTLAEVTRRGRTPAAARSAGGAKVSVGAAAWLVRELARALEPAHQAAMFHGAISPESVWITRVGRIRLLHLGAAGLCTTLERGMRSTMGLALAQPYLAPEQVLQNHADPRTDVFMLGVILYELLAEHTLFLRSSPHETREAIVGGKIADLDVHVPEELAELTMSCLERNPSFRPQSASSLRAKLDGPAAASGEAELVELLRRS